MEYQTSPAEAVTRSIRSPYGVTSPRCGWEKLAADAVLKDISARHDLRYLGDLPSVVRTTLVEKVADIIRECVPGCECNAGAVDHRDSLRAAETRVVVEPTILSDAEAMRTVVEGLEELIVDEDGYTAHSRRPNAYAGRKKPQGRRGAPDGLAELRRAQVTDELLAGFLDINQSSA